MRKFLNFVLIVAIIGGLGYGGYYLWESTGFLEFLSGIKVEKILQEAVEKTEEKEAICTVTFDSSGGSAIESQSVENGKTITHPGFPTRGGYTFVGWYTTNTYEELFDFSKAITKSCTVHARWVDTTDKTDTDGDGLTDPVEDFYGTDKSLADTDGDLLSDYQELAILNLNPLKVDSDDDGVNDGDEDVDGDTITNAEEIRIGTDPTQKDTDDDGVDDADEINLYLTNPVVQDTDGDGANDGWELNNNFDPLSFDDTFDIVVKADPISEESPVTALVQIQTSGEQASALKVEEVSENDNLLLTDSIPGYLGSAYDFSTKGEIESATITFEYDTSIGEISDEFQPRIYYFNEETGLLEELENQTVENGRVSVTVVHFSKYILLNKVAFDKVWESDIKPPEYEGDGINGIDFVFVIDSSGSMSSNDGNKIRHSAVIQFIEKMGENDRAAIVDFDGSARVYQTFTDDKTLLTNAVNKVDSSGGTNLSNGMSAAINQFTDVTYTRTDAYKYIIFLTDGNGSYSSSYTTQAADNGIIVYTIGLGSGVKPAVLQDIANGTGGKYYFATIDLNLLDIYNDVSFETIDYAMDTNEDGISDYYTKLIFDGTLVLSNGSSQFAGIDFNFDKNGNLSDDYDGDGIKNGDELIVTQIGDVVYMEMKSNPTDGDTDGDGYLDGEDANLLKWNVSDRDLAMLSQLIYCDELLENPNFDLFDDNTISSMNEKFYGTASVRELKGWRLVYRHEIVHTGKEGGLCYGVFQKDNNVVIAVRGSVGELDIGHLADTPDWYNNFLTYTWTTDLDTETLLANICRVVDEFQKPGYNLYITGHSRGGMLAQRAAAGLVENGYEEKIDRVVYFNGIGIVFIKGAWGTGRDWYDNLESISSKVTRFYIEGDIVDGFGVHVIKDESRISYKCTDVAKRNYEKYAEHALCNFTYYLMPERLSEIKK